MKHIITIALTIAFSVACVASVAPEIDYWWDIETTTDSAVPIPPIRRGESLLMRPRLLVRRTPADLSGVTQVSFRYWTDDMVAGQNYYVITGSVHSAAGRVTIPWTPAADSGANAYYYQLRVGNAEGQIYRGHGTMTIRGVFGTAATNYVRAVQTWDWQDWEHINTAFAPFLTQDDKLALQARLDGHDQDIEDLTSLVGTGVQGVQDELDAHIAAQAGRDAGQDAQINLALQSANMGGDVEGVSSNARVVKLQGRALPPVGEVPSNNQAMIWDSALNRWVHRLVDLSPIQAAISNLIATAATVGYVDTEISRVEGMVDGNDHVLQLTEDFEAADWLEIANNVWQHNTYGWIAQQAIVVNGEIRLLPDAGTLVVTTTGHVSRVALTGAASPYLVSHAQSAAGPWTGYDPVKDNIALTNRFAIRVWNTGGTQAVVSRLQLYSWTHPERVGATRDFTGLNLRVDTPTGTDIREAANVQYVRQLAATGSISGTFGTGFSVDRIKATPVSTAGLLNGMGLIYYTSVNEFRPVDLATQFELDAAIAPLASIAALSDLAARVTATEAGGIAISGDVFGTHLQTTRVDRIRGVEIDTPAGDQYSPVYDIATGRIMWRSILSSNAVYAVGSNDVYSLPPQAAGFYRTMFETNAIMPFVVDHQILGWLGSSGLTIPYGTLNLMQSNLTANVRMYDGTAAIPAISTLSDPGTGWYRPGANLWRYVAAGNIITDFGIGGITMMPGKTITLQDGSRAVSLAEVTGGISLIELDPLAIHRSTTTQAWIHAGGTYTDEVVVATSPPLTNGVASVAYMVAPGAGMQVIVEMADLNLSTWEPFAPFTDAGYVRVRLAELLPSPIDRDTTITNIVAMSWTRPDLVGAVRDTAGQIIHVDTATQPRQPVTLAQMQASVSAITPATWSQYPATQNVRLNGHKLLLGGGWSVIEVEGVGVVSYADAWGSTNGLVIANNGTPAITAHAGLTGLRIDHFTLDGGTATVGVATNNVASDPIIQWTASLMAPDWQIVPPDSTSDPHTTTNGWYEYIVTLPGSAGFLRAVRETGAARVDVHAPLYVQGAGVATTSQVAAAEVRIEALEVLPSFTLDGTNLLITINGVTNRVMLETWIDE